MKFARIHIENWRNFTRVDVPLQQRMFLIGPNASGKSNLLDAFRFLRDLVRVGGGLEKAVADRGGVARLRSLAARRSPEIVIDVHIANGEAPNWQYRIGIVQDHNARAYLKEEQVWKAGQLITDCIFWRGWRYKLIMMPVNVLVEGPTDEPVAKKLLEHVGLEVGIIYGRKGKAHLLERAPIYNKAAYFAPWFVLVDLDMDEQCPSQAVLRFGDLVYQAYGATVPTPVLLYDHVASDRLQLPQQQPQL
jgi:hypothetical protein